MARNAGSEGIAATAAQYRATAVTPHDTTPLDPPANALLVIADGDLRIASAGGALLDAFAVVAGQVIPIVTRIVHTDTTATVLALDNENDN